MKNILTLLIIIPIFTFAQSKSGSAKALPLIESITSDTIKGRFNQLLFEYDQHKRVISIIKKQINNSIEQIIEKQSFQYNGTDLDPISRKLVLFDFDVKGNKWNLVLNEYQYFLYQNGQLVGDSTLYFDKSTQAWTLKYIGTVSNSESSIETRVKIPSKKDDEYSDSDIYLDNFYKDDSTRNISDDISEHDYGRSGRDRSFYKYEKYDEMVNPLNLLNIKNALANEKLSVTTDGRYGNIAFCWYFMNQNNALTLETSTEDFNSSIDEIYRISYTYNQYNQPVFVKTLVKQSFRRIDKPYKSYQKHYTFRYKH